MVPILLFPQKLDSMFECEQYVFEIALSSSGGVPTDMYLCSRLNSHEFNLHYSTLSYTINYSTFLIILPYCTHRPIHGPQDPTWPNCPHSRHRMLRTFKIQRMSPSRWAGAMGKDLPPELVSWCQLSACPSRLHVGWAMRFGIENTQIKSLQQPCHWVFMHCLCIFTWAAMGSCPTSSFSPICQPVVLKLPSDVPHFLEDPQGRPRVHMPWIVSKQATSPLLKF